MRKNARAPYPALNHHADSGPIANVPQRATAGRRAQHAYIADSEQRTGYPEGSMQRSSDKIGISAPDADVKAGPDAGPTAAFVLKQSLCERRIGRRVPSQPARNEFLTCNDSKSGSHIEDRLLDTVV
jgi:hypothetical protein